MRPTLDRTPLVKVTKAKLIELRNALKSSDDPISNATINTLFASLSSAYGYFVEQGWCSENPLRLIEDLEVAERPSTWLQSAGARYHARGGGHCARSRAGSIKTMN